MHFLPAAVLLTRVVSLPAPDSICLDLGYKSVSSEIAHPRVVFPELPDAKAVTHNEEHLVLQLGQAHGFEPGHAFFGIPWHVCPSVALHNEAAIIRDGAFEEIIPITARGRRLTL
jgi:D-serine deaminase-like pyridoxal phosphate-dependent protein